MQAKAKLSANETDKEVSPRSPQRSSLDREAAMQTTLLKSPINELHEETAAAEVPSTTLRPPDTLKKFEELTKESSSEKVGGSITAAPALSASPVRQQNQQR